jgi:hypothetical protein
MKVILWGLVIIIVPAFVMWGGASSSRSKNSGPNYVGFVDNRKISFEELSNALSGVRCQVILNYFNQPKVLDTLLSNKPLLAKLAWDRILMMNETKKAGIRTSDKEIVDALQNHPLFMRNGVFDDKFYTYMLRNNIGLEPRAFEEIERENISLQKLSTSLTKDITVSDADILADYKKDYAKIKISYILFEPKDYYDQVKVDDAAVKDFYEKNKGGLMIKPDPKIGGAERPATFEEAKLDIERYFKDVEARKIIKEKAGSIHKELLEKMGIKGGTFAGAAAKQGLTVKEADFFSKKDTVEALGDTGIIVEASYALKDLELSSPLETKKGYMIFQVVDKKDADEEGFAKEKEVYSKKVLETKRAPIMEAWLKELEEKAKLEIKLEDADKIQQQQQ